MKRLTTTTLNWFDDGCCDVKYLDLWNNAPLNYYPGQPIDESWHTDHYEQLLGNDPTGTLFQASSKRLMRYQFYPTDILNHVSDFDLYERPIRVGDRIVQRIHVFQLFGRSVLDAITMTEVTDVITGPRRCGFTYATVDTHIEQGEWTAMLEWKNSGDVILSIDAISRPVPHEPSRNYTLIRSLQIHANQEGLEYFSQCVHEDTRHRIEG